MKIVDHQPGHIGCCDDAGDGTMGFTYKPGAAQALADPANAQYKGKRNLSVDEFEYYYRMLEDPAISVHGKIAVALVLRADMIRLYKGSPDYAEDEYLKQWADQYTTLPEATKQLVNGEVAAFDAFLTNSKLADYYPANIIPFIEAADAYQIAANQKAIEDQAMIKQMEDERNKQIEYIKYQAMEDLKKAVAEFDLTMTSDQEAYIRKNFEDYLKGIENGLDLNMALDAEKMKMKDAAYQDVVGKFNRNEMTYEEAMSLYAKRLEEINAMEVGTLLFGKSYIHPMLTYGLVPKKG